MAVDKQRVCDVLRDDTGLVYVDIVDVITDIDTTALAGIGWLDNPHIFLALMLFQLLIMVIEVSKLIWQDVGVWAEVKRSLSEPFLQAHNIETQTILSSDLVTLREVIDLLILIEPFILVALART